MFYTDVAVFVCELHDQLSETEVVNASSVFIFGNGFEPFSWFQEFVFNWFFIRRRLEKNDSKKFSVLARHALFFSFAAAKTFCIISLLWGEVFAIEVRHGILPLQHRQILPTDWLSCCRRTNHQPFFRCLLNCLSHRLLVVCLWCLLFSYKVFFSLNPICTMFDRPSSVPN